MIAADDLQNLIAAVGLWDAANTDDDRLHAGNALASAALRVIVKDGSKP